MSKCEDMSNCEKMLDHIYEFLNKCDISQEQSEEINKHLDMCRKCYDRFEFEQKLLERFRKTENCSCPEKLKNKIKNLVDDF